MYLLVDTTTATALTIEVGAMGRSANITLAATPGGLTTVSSSTMKFDYAGNLNLGTGTGSQSGWNVDIGSTTAARPVLRLIKTNSGTANEAGGTLYFANQGPSNLARAVGTLLGQIVFQSSQPTSQALQNTASIAAYSDAQAGTGTAGYISFSTSDATGGGNNTERVRIDSAGNLAVGGGGGNAKLEVKGGATLTSLTTWNSGANTTFTLANPGVKLGIGYDATDQPLIQGFDSTNAARPIILQLYGGSVGVGANPSFKFDVQQSQNAATVIRTYNGNTGSSAAAVLVTQTDAATMNIYAQSSTNVSGGVAATSGLQITTNTPMAFSTNGTERMRITAAGDVGIGTGSPQRKFQVTGDAGIGVLPTAGDGITTLSAVSTGITTLDVYHGTIPAQFVVRTNTTGGGGTSEKFRIDGAGNVGIGTAAPGRLLDVYSTAATFARIQSATTAQSVLQVSNNTLGNNFYFGIDTSTGGAFGAGAYGRVLFSDGAFPMAFATNSTERMRIDSTGSLLIGLTSTLSSAVKLQMSDGTISSLFGYKSGGVEFLGTYSNHPLAFLTANAERMRITSGGDVLFGTTSTTLGNDTTGWVGISGGGLANPIVIHIPNNATTQWIYQSFYRGSVSMGNIQYNGTGTSYITTSDGRRKQNIVDAPSALQTVKSIRVRSFDWKDSTEHTEFGFVAQELQTVASDAVHVGGDDADKDPWGVDPSKLVATLTKALQEALSEIDSLKARVAALEI
jgi:hypothetical protein